MALESLGGVSVSYQISHNPIPQVLLGSAADIFFAFGPYYLPFVQANQNNNNTVISCGYVTDYSFDAVKESSNALRAQMEKCGAKYIATYLDENSSDDRMSLVSTSKNEAIYRTFFDRVISDKTFGLVCSPKRPNTL